MKFDSSKCIPVSPVSDKNTMQDTKLTFLLTDLAVEPFYNSVALAQLVTKTECVTGAFLSDRDWTLMLCCFFPKTLPVDFCILPLMLYIFLRHSRLPPQRHLASARRAPQQARRRFQLRHLPLTAAATGRALVRAPLLRRVRGAGRCVRGRVSVLPQGARSRSGAAQRRRRAVALHGSVSDAAGRRRRAL